MLTVTGFKNYLLDMLWPNRIIENLNEMATIGRDNRRGLLMQVNPDEGRQGLEYFKFYNAFSRDHANKFARIEFRRPEYVIHGNMGGKKKWFLNGREKDDLMDFLNSQNSTRRDLTNWRYGILAFNQEKGLDPEMTEQNLLAARQLPYPNYLPFDLQMPDYRQLQKR